MASNAVFSSLIARCFSVSAVVLAGCQWQPTTGDLCVGVDDAAATCPAAADVDREDLFDPVACEFRQAKISDPGVLEDHRYEWEGDDQPSSTVCCYPAKYVSNGDCLD
jgi:hypothetical protein